MHFNSDKHTYKWFYNSNRDMIHCVQQIATVLNIAVRYRRLWKGAQYGV